MVTTYQQPPSLSKKEHFLGIAMLLAFLLPHTNTLFLLVNPLLCLILVASNFKSRHMHPFALIVLIPIVISMMLNLNYASLKAFQSTFAILLYFICFPFVGQVKIRNIYLYICLSYILISQLVYLLDIPVLERYFEITYPIGSKDTSSVGYMSKHIRYDTILSYRLGGIYHNANNCAEYLCMLMAFFLLNNQYGKSKATSIFSLIIYLGILLTGSRSGFAVASLIAYFGLIKQGFYKKRERYLFFALILIGIVYLIGSGAALRSLDVKSGFSDSANKKWVTFVYYLTNENSIIALLFGHFDSSLFVGLRGKTIMGYFDCEYGDLIYRFGFIGFICILLFWWKTSRGVEKGRRFFFLILLWIFTSSIVAAYRAVFIFLLLLSVVYSNYGINEKHKTFRSLIHW